MQQDRSDSQGDGAVEQAVLATLLDDRVHLWSREELIREVAGQRGNRGDVTDAIGSLYAAGLVHVVDGDFLFATRAAVQTDQIAM